MGLRTRRIGALRIEHLVLTLGLSLAAVPVGAQSAPDLPGECGSLANGYGPFDYNNPDDRQTKWPIVEQNHFDGGVQRLVGHGKPGGPSMLGGDIDYVLRAFPNHPGALYTMMRYKLTHTPLTEPKMRYSAECYFLRAESFRPDDATVRAIHGHYLHKTGDDAGARKRYEEALKLDPASPEVNYNAALFYLDIKENKLALARARKAYMLGYPLPGLRDRLRRLGLWTDAPASTQGAAGDAATTASADQDH
jgi:hypothetical protein